MRLILLVLFAFLVGCPNLSPFGRDDDDDGANDDDAGDDDVADDDDSGDDDDSTAGDDDDDDDTSAGDDDDSTPVLTSCEEALSGPSNVGCIFWAVDLDNAENFIDDASAGQFAVAVANNSSTDTAHVEVTINDADPGQPLQIQLVEMQDIAPGSLYVFLLPRRDVDGDWVTINVDDGPQTWHSSRAFRIESDNPVVAYQFNTLDQQYSNDASLLLPQSALGFNHLVVGWEPNAPIAPPLGPGNRSYVTIVANAEGTSVTVTPTYDIVNGPGVPEVSPGVGIVGGTSATFTLGPYDVLNLETILIDPFQFPIPDMPELTGTTVSSTERVAVFFGNDLTTITDGLPEEGNECCAEHIEQQILPNRAMRSQYVVSRSAARVPSDPEIDVYRIIALFDSTTVTTNLPGDDGFFNLQAKEYREIRTNTGFIVDSSQPLHVAQFLVRGSDAGYIGDNSLLYVPPVEQRRDSYIFTTGQGFSEHWAVVSMEDGTSASIDGVPVDASSCSGPATDGVLNTITYVTWTCEISEAVHGLQADADVGLLVYGYYNAGSYSYPAGAGLE